MTLFKHLETSNDDVLALSLEIARLVVLLIENTNKLDQKNSWRLDLSRSKVGWHHGHGRLNGSASAVKRSRTVESAINSGSII